MQAGGMENKKSKRHVSESPKTRSSYVAEQMAQRGEAVLPEALLPDYHRLSQAERERAERLAAEAARTEIPEDTAKGKDQHQ